jgi:hypothetical protein
VKQDKVRKLFTGQIVELHGLVGAYKLNGQWAECKEFDVDMQRYLVTLKSGETKKVKPQNVKPIGTYRSEMANVLQLKSLSEIRRSTGKRSEIIQTLKKWNCVVPSVVSARVMVDWAKLDKEDLRQRLLDSKKVSIETLPDDVCVVSLSLPRTRLTMTEPPASLRDIVKSLGPGLENRILKNQVYWLLPFECIENVDLGMIKRSFFCSYPLYGFLLDRLVLCMDRDDDPSALRSSMQRLDVMAAHRAGTEILVHEKGGSKNILLGLALPSQGKCEEDQIDFLKDAEKILMRQTDQSKSSVIQCQFI